MRTLNKWKLISLFAINGSGISHYGYHVGVKGNWLMSLLDLSITALLLWFALRKTKINTLKPKQ